MSSITIHDVHGAAPWIAAIVQMNALAKAFAVINRKGMALLMFRPLPGMSLFHDLNRISPNSISVVVTGSPELKLVATLQTLKGCPRWAI